MANYPKGIASSSPALHDEGGLPERGCVVLDQPQWDENTRVSIESHGPVVFGLLRLVFDTAALRGNRGMSSRAARLPFGRFSRNMGRHEFEFRQKGQTS